MIVLEFAQPHALLIQSNAGEAWTLMDALCLIPVSQMLQVKTHLKKDLAFLCIVCSWGTMPKLLPNGLQPSRYGLLRGYGPSRLPHARYVVPKKR